MARTARVVARRMQACRSAGPEGGLVVITLLPVLMDALGASVRNSQGAGCLVVRGGRPDGDGEFRRANVA